jgi:hypothetical protein
MNPDPLDDRLAVYAKRTLPTVTGPSAAAVWREIDRRREQSVWARMFSILELRELFAEPRMALAAVAFALVVGVVPAALVSRSENERRLARQSIHFEVFAVHSGSLASVFMRPGARAMSQPR